MLKDTVLEYISKNLFYKKVTIISIKSVFDIYNKVITKKQWNRKTTYLNVIDFVTKKKKCHYTLIKLIY